MIYFGCEGVFSISGVGGGHRPTQCSRALLRHCMRAVCSKSSECSRTLPYLASPNQPWLRFFLLCGVSAAEVRKVRQWREQQSPPSRFSRDSPGFLPLRLQTTESTCSGVPTVAYSHVLLRSQPRVHALAAAVEHGTWSMRTYCHEHKRPPPPPSGHRR